MKSGFASFLLARARKRVPRRGARTRIAITKTEDEKQTARSERESVLAGHLKLVVKLFRAENRILERLGRREAKPSARRNLDLLPGRRIAAHPRLGLALAEDTEPGQAQRTFLLEFLHDQRIQFLEHGLGLFFCDADFLGHIRSHLRLRHHPPP